MNDIKNVLAFRYAGQEIKDLFSEKGKILLEREFWIALLKAQKELGLPITDEVIAAYEKVKNTIDPDKIDQREQKLRHDVKARLEIFCEAAGYEQIHQGLTSRDLTDNVEQYQILKAMQIIRLKTIRALMLLAERAVEYESLVMAARTHNVAAQPTTFGKRLAMFGQEILIALERFDFLIEHNALRGVKGAVGTMMDQLTLFNHDKSKVRQLEKRMAEFLGFKRVLNAVGQVYPRSMDYDVVSCLAQLAAGPSSFSKTLRLMAGHELAGEGFAKGQVGSSAMPHKMNSRSSERICGFETLLKGYTVMLLGLSGDQWNEGDVSCSVVRRVAIPDAFFAMDGLLETFMTVLKEMGTYDTVIQAELDKYLPFLATTTLLMAALKKGCGRETAHHLIKKHALQTVDDLRQGRIPTNDLLQRLGNDTDFPLNGKELQAILKNPLEFTAMAADQVKEFAKSVESWSRKFPNSRQIEPEKIR